MRHSHRHTPTGSIAGWPITRFALSDLDHDRLRRVKFQFRRWSATGRILYHLPCPGSGTTSAQGTRPIAINAGGDIAGPLPIRATFFTASRAPLPEPFPPLTLLAQTTLGDARSFVSDINAAGTIVGSYVESNSAPRLSSRPERHLHHGRSPQ